MRDYVELVKELRYCGDRNNLDCKGCSRKPTPICDDELKSAAADAIEELLAESAELRESLDLEKECYQKLYEDYTDLLSAVPKWISVDERLPEIGKFVLVSDGDDIDAACRYKAFTIPDEVETFFWDSVLEVTHWMPLPEPPKEETE